jgi:hypothetical protein
VKKILISLALIVITLLALSHYRAYFYSDETLNSMALSSFEKEVSQNTSCEEVKPFKNYRSDKLNEVIVYQWLCLNKAKDSYLIASTVESDGYVDNSRIALSDEEIDKLSN